MNKAVQLIKKTAKENLETTGTLAPIFLAVSKNKKEKPMFIHLSSMPNDKVDKFKLMTKIGVEISKNMKELDKVFFCSDTWFSQTALETGLAPSESKDKKEALMVVESYIEKKSPSYETIFLPYERKGEKITWCKEVKSKETASTLLNSLWAAYIVIKEEKYSDDILEILGKI